MLENLVATWNTLDTRRRVVMVASVVIAVGAIVLLSKIASAPRLSLLYGGLDPASASEIITALDQDSIVYEVRGDAIFVDDRERDSLRLTLAGQGLPSGNAPGYELLDGLSGFGTTSQMFDAAYWRAKEGELARTISAAPNIAAARVHISAASGTTFRRSASPTASILATTRTGSLDVEQARALRFLVAAAVPGLNQSDVSVIDGQTGLVLGMGGVAGGGSGGPKQEETLRRSVERLIEARVGPGNAVVELSIDYVTERESIVERLVDPTTRVAISQETEERSTSSQGGSEGAVTVASNLPDGDAAATGTDARSENTEVREIVNFDVSETQREIIREPGAIRRLTVAVLVNGVTKIDDTGTEVIATRATAELDVLGDLVKSAIGFDPERGDQITIKSLAFETIALDGSGPAQSQFGGLDLTTVATSAILGIVALATIMFVLRPMLAASAASAPPALPSGEPQLNIGDLPGAYPEPEPEPDPTALVGEIDDGGFDVPTMNTVTDFGMSNAAAPTLPNPSGSSDPVDRLKLMISERQEETMEILRSWMEDGREKT